jgi:hypothetical protein
MSNYDRFDTPSNVSNPKGPDDGWWQSLMSEEYKYAPSKETRPRKP